MSQRSDRRIVEVANALAADLYAATPSVRPIEARPDAGEGSVRALVHPTYADELVWLAGQVSASHAAMAEPRWSEIGVLTRDNSHAADVFDALTSREIPVEIVGLKGLMRLPEVSEVVSTLALLQDLTANADLLNLLTGPRWAIGPRDLALLGRRARALAGVVTHVDGLTVSEELQRAVEGADPTEVVSLSDALTDPGDLPYSAARRWSGSGCWPASCGCCAPTRGSPCSTSSAGSSTPPASTSSWPRPSRPRPRPGATTSTSS